MPKYHINSKGNPGPCKATIECPYGDLQKDHYSTVKEARKAFEKRMSENEKHLSGRKKNKKLSTETINKDYNAKYSALSDVDGTITRGSLVLDHAIYLHEKGEIQLGDLPEKWKKDPKNEKLITELAESYKTAIKGKTKKQLQIKQFLEDYDKRENQYYSTLSTLKELKKRGWEVRLISGSPDFLVEPFAKKHGFFAKGSEYKMKAGRISGEVIGMFGGEAKAEYISKLELDRFKRVISFGDTSSDIPLFENSHHSTLVDPSKETAAKVITNTIIKN